MKQNARRKGGVPGAARFHFPVANFHAIVYVLSHRCTRDDGRIRDDYDLQELESDPDREQDADWHRLRARLRARARLLSERE
jgi:hypothetical protein